MSEKDDIELVLRTARLARLELSADEARAFAPQFERILAAFRTLAQLDLEGVEPLARPAELADVLRDDVPRPGLERETVLRAAPAVEDGFLRVPKTVGGEA